MENHTYDQGKQEHTAASGDYGGARFDWRPVAVSCALVAMVVLAGSLSGADQAGDPDLPADVVTSRVVIGFEHDVPERLPDYIAALGGQVVLAADYLPFIVVSLDPAQSQSLLEAAQEDPSVSYAEYDRLVYPTYNPTDVLWFQQWTPHTAVKLPDAWDTTFGSHDIDIHILDTGVDFTHADLLPNLACGLPGADFISTPVGPGPGVESGFHGTHVAGIASAAMSPNNAIDDLGVAGASQSCITPVRVLMAESGLAAWVAAGIYWSADNGAEIISMSLGASSGTTTLANAVDYAYNTREVLILAAAGNDGCPGSSGSGTVGFPAAYDEVIAVAALTGNGGAPAGYSSCGPEVEISAPGSIWSTLPGNTYGPLSGTSMATPLVSGIAGLAWSEDTNLTHIDMRCILEKTAGSVGSYAASRVGAGIVDADAAVAAASNPSSVGC